MEIKDLLTELTKFSHQLTVFLSDLETIREVIDTSETEDQLERGLERFQDLLTAFDEEPLDEAVEAIREMADSYGESLQWLTENAHLAADAVTEHTGCGGWYSPDSLKYLVSVLKALIDM